MKLNENLPYATIYGHHSATYEQGGVLFNGGGEPVKPDAAPAALASVDYDAEAFLSELLRGTPMSRKKVAEVAEQAGIAWFDVENAAAALNVERRRQGFGETWKLIEG
jgi:hypothetical protein